MDHQDYQVGDIVEVISLEYSSPFYGTGTIGSKGIIYEANRVGQYCWVEINNRVYGGRFHKSNLNNISSKMRLNLKGITSWDNR